MIRYSEERLWKVKREMAHSSDLSDEMKLSTLEELLLFKKDKKMWIKYELDMSVV
jgi:hypothetical protein